MLSYLLRQIAIVAPPWQDSIVARQRLSSTNMFRPIEFHDRLIMVRDACFATLFAFASLAASRETTPITRSAMLGSVESGRRMCKFTR